MLELRIDVPTVGGVVKTPALFLAPLVLLQGVFSQVDDGVDAQARAILKRNCMVCHGGSKPAGDLDLSSERNISIALETPKKRSEVLKTILDDPMPPDADRECKAPCP